MMTHQAHPESTKAPHGKIWFTSTCMWQAIVNLHSQASRSCAGESVDELGRVRCFPLMRYIHSFRFTRASAATLAHISSGDAKRQADTARIQPTATMRKAEASTRLKQHPILIEVLRCVGPEPNSLITLTTMNLRVPHPTVLLKTWSRHLER